MTCITNDWYNLLKEDFSKEYYIKLMNFLKKEYDTFTVYPPKDDIYTALKLTAFKDVNVVILGQDPYHGANQAHGLAFSVNLGIPTPKSLINIYKELKDDEGTYIPNNGHLIDWSKQGVLLLNTALTVRANEANSHKNKGWEILTDRIISILNTKKDPIVFILWGNNARFKKALITSSIHFVIESAHPSPLSASRGFLGSKPFSKANNFLKSINKNQINWQIKNI